MTFMIQWLLASVAFAVWAVPMAQPTPITRTMQILVSGVLLAIVFGLLQPGMIGRVG